VITVSSLHEKTQPITRPVLTRPKLTYFDAPVSRGEECRLALHVAGVDFEDVRLKRDEWAALKPTTPFGSLPTFEVEGHAPLAQSNAILVYIGRHWGLHPKDDWEAARHEAMMSHLEDLRAAISPTLRIADEAEKKKAREAVATTTLPAWCTFAERQMGDGPFFGGAKPSVVDFKIYVVVRWLTSGALDHIPTSIVQGFPKLMRAHDAVRDHERVKEWTARHAK
jgi:glutathione S-transferase